MPPLLVFFRLGCWFLSQPRLRIWTLLVASPLFYAWGAPLLLPLILFLAAIKSWLG